MDRSFRGVFERKRKSGKGQKSGSFLVNICTRARPVLTLSRVTVLNPATGQNLCTYAHHFFNPTWTFSNLNSPQGDFSFTLRCTDRNPSCTFGLQGGLLVENTHCGAVSGSLEPR